MSGGEVEGSAIFVLFCFVLLLLLLLLLLLYSPFLSLYLSGLPLCE